MVAPEVMEDWNYFQKEKVTFASYPYPETLGFMCGDVILECSGHILLIKRARAPGRNTWALPGGFKNTYETLLDAAIRELIEETNIRIVEKVLRGSIVSTQLFDSPSRCLGIPRVSLAVHIKIALDKDGSLPRANGKFQGEGGGEVVDVQWIPMTDIMNDIDMFDDHKDIISKMCGIMPVPAYLNPRFVELKI
jgi:bifunctional NMN adenylyltransferase/nudix hydrolase